MTLLGIVIDTLKRELRLPEDKLQRVVEASAAWSNRKSCSRKELESLVGTLCYAARVIQPGRSFLRQAISLLSVAREGHHYIRLNAQFRADMLWWESLSSHWNGASLISTLFPIQLLLPRLGSVPWQQYVMPVCGCPIPAGTTFLHARLRSPKRLKRQMLVPPPCYLQKLSPQTIITYLAGVRHMQVTFILASPEVSAVRNPAHALSTGTSPQGYTTHHPHNPQADPRVVGT